MSGEQEGQLLRQRFGSEAWECYGCGKVTVPNHGIGQFVRGMPVCNNDCADRADRDRADRANSNRDAWMTF